MGKIIRIDEKKDYINLKNNSIKMLRDLHAKLDEIALNLAAYGQWNEWNEKQPEGRIISFEEMMKDIDDKNVLALLELKEKVLKTINILK